MRSQLSDTNGNIGNTDNEFLVLITYSDMVMSAVCGFANTEEGLFLLFRKEYVVHFYFISISSGFFSYVV